MKLLKILCLLSLFSVSQTACHSHKEVAETQIECSTNGIVKDFSGLDGCGLLIIGTNGDKFLPINTDQLDFTLQNGQKIRFSYKKVKDMASICMMGTMIDITCLSLIKKSQMRKKECFDIKEKPTKVAWMKKTIAKHQAEQVIKYTYRTDGWAYLFTGKNIFLYDCQGTLICSEKAKEECLKFVEYESLGKGVIIWEGLGSNE